MTAPSSPSAPSSAASDGVEFGTTNFCAVFTGAQVAVANEALGYDIQLFGENHNMAADLFGEMRDAARATSRIKLMAGPVNFVTRDPGVIASAIAPVQLLSEGRAICGIARGDSAVALAGPTAVVAAAAVAAVAVINC